MRFFRSVWRSLVLAGLFFYAGMQLILNRPRDRVARAEWLHQFCARALRRLDVKVESTGPFPERGVLIANHLSYIDIVAFAALHRCVFCSKAEIEHWAVVGWLATMAGTVFVQRGRGGSAAKAATGMQAAAAEGIPVIFFPEGTTSNGACLLKFHSGLLAQAMLSKEPIYPAYIRFHLDQDNGPDVSIADDVAFWGDRNMLAHIFKLLGLRGLRVEMRLSETPIHFSSDALHRKRAAEEARVAVVGLSAGAGRSPINECPATEDEGEADGAFAGSAPPTSRANPFPRP